MSWFQSVFRRHRLYHDLAEELRGHMEEKIEHLERLGGMTRQEAERQARKAFGNAALIEERSKEVWQWRILESVWADARFALRQMPKTPGFTFTIVLLLSLGVGSVSTVFSITDAILLRPVPYPDPSTLVIP
jgi:putative ABC transport system permease protein